MMPGLNRLVGRLLYAFPQMANVLFLTAFVIIAFAVIGMQLFCDRTPGVCSKSQNVRAGYRSRCPHQAGGQRPVRRPRQLFPARRHLHSRALGRTQVCTLPLRLVANAPDECVARGEGVCERTTVVDGIYLGINTFDTFFWSVLTVFECITMEVRELPAWVAAWTAGNGPGEGCALLRLLRAARAAGTA